MVTSARPVTCLNCGYNNSADASFCQNCGQPLGSRSSAGERRVVTILFCDVEGSTALAEQLDPEEWTEIMNGAFQYLIEPVYRYEGTVSRLMGDAVLAFFGAPTAHEDDAQRAVLAALDILEEIQPYRERLRRHHRMEFNVRIGINTGLVVVGDVGSRLRVEYTAMGDAVNLAARMQQTAEPGTIQISGDTYKLVAPLFDCEPLGSIEVKGKREPVPAYRVTGVKAQPGSLRGIEGLESPLIGRDAQVAQLRQAIADLRQGRGQIVCLIGEAGLGKSRLIRELYREWATTGTNGAGFWSESQARSYDASHPYSLFRQHIRSICRVNERDEPETLRAQILSAAERSALPVAIANCPVPQPDRVQHAFELLLGLEAERSNGQSEQGGETAKEELFETMLDFWRSQAMYEPVVLVFDDLHWSDPASVDLLLHLFQLTDEAPILFLCAFRAHRGSPSWQVHQTADTDYPHRYREISLQPLTMEESSALVDELLRLVDLPARLRRLVLDKTEGNPFFVEEVVRELIESGAVRREEGKDGAPVWRATAEVGQIAIPDNLQALLMARIDRLDEEVRYTLQLASVIGRSFRHQILAMIPEAPAELNRHLAQLQRAGLVYESGRRPDLEYTFRHALTHEVVYQSILLRQRRTFHRQVAETIEQLDRDHPEDVASLLAQHYFEAGDYGRAFDCFSLAGDRAARLYALAEAISHYSMALDVADRLDIREQEPERLLALLRQRGVAYETLGEFERARADQEAALALATEMGDRRAEWQAHLDLGFLWVSRDYDQADAYFRRALELARQLDDPGSLADSLNRYGNWLVNASRTMEAQPYHAEALALFEKLDNRHGRAETLDLLGMASMMSGNFRQSTAYFEQAIALFRELDERRGLTSSLASLGESSADYFMDIVMPVAPLEESIRNAEEALQVAQQIGHRAGEVYALIVLSIGFVSAGEYGRSLEASQHGLELARAIDHRQWITASLFTRGAILFDLLILPEARAYMEEAMELARQTASQLWIDQVGAGLARLYLVADEPDRAEALLMPLLQPEEALGSVMQRSFWYVAAQLALARGQPELALKRLERVIAATPNLDVEPGVVPGLWLARAEVLAALGRMADAESDLQAALEAAVRRRSQPALWRLYGALGQLYQATGQQDEAEAAFARAQGIVEELAQKVPSGIKERFVDGALAFIFRRGID